MRDTSHQLAAQNLELEQVNREIKDAHLQLYQQEKMASIGQLAAGVAHEINNPLGFINSNLGTLDKYIQRLKQYLAAIDPALNLVPAEQKAEVTGARTRFKVNYMLEDAPDLIEESLDGVSRVQRIVQDLKSFSRMDQDEGSLANLNDLLETSINIAWNEIK